MERILLTKIKMLLSKAKDVYKEKGICYAIYSGTKKILNWMASLFHLYIYKIFDLSETFTFQGNVYRYFYHTYNETWKNERAVEVPIVWEIVKKYNGRNILEVGNVLSNYFSVNHDIVDKYEKVEGVINQDAVNFRPFKKYDLIINISTLEHIGWDENPYNPMKINSHDSMKILRVIKNLKKLITPRGEIIITLPLGQNPKLDKLLREGKIQFTRRFCLKRMSKDNKWKEASWNDICDAKYGKPFPFANGLIIGVIGRK